MRVAVNTRLLIENEIEGIIDFLTKFLRKYKQNPKNKIRFYF